MQSCSLLPSRSANLTVFLRFQSLWPPVRGLLLFAKHLFVVAIAAIASRHAKNDVCGNAQVVFAIKASVRFCLPLCQNLLCQHSPNDRDRSCLRHCSFEGFVHSGSWIDGPISNRLCWALRWRCSHMQRHNEAKREKASS